MFKIIYGTENSNREKYVDELILNRMKRKETSWILVPEQFSFTSELEVIKKYGLSAQKYIKVISFSRLCNLVFSKLGPLRLKYIDGAGKQIIAARTVRALKNRLGVLERSLTRKGFSSDIVELVSEFKRYGVTSDELFAVSESVSDTDLAEKLKDISAIFKTFDDFLNQQAADAEDNPVLIKSKIKDCDFINGTVFIRYFRTFTPVESEIIVELAKLSDIYLSLCLDNIEKGAFVFEATINTAKNITEDMEQAGVSVEAPICISDNDSESEIAYLARNYFSFYPKLSENIPTQIEIIESANYYREVESAADLILKLCRTENRRFSDFLILASETDKYNRIMPSIFASRGIDVFLDSKRSILVNPLVKLIINSLDIFTNGFSYERVMEIARTGLTSASEDKVDLFENYILAVNPSHAMWNSDVWSYKLDGYDLDEINDTRNCIFELLNAIKEKAKGKITADKYCSAILYAFEKCSLAGKFTNICDGFSEKGMTYLADEYRQVWNSVISVLAQISVLMDDEPISRADFFDLFETALSGINIGLSPQTQGSVIFSSTEMFRSSDIPIVIVLGMTEGVFPKTFSGEGLISDGEREELLKMGIRLAPTMVSRMREEQLLVYSVLTAPTEKLYLSYPMSNIKGEQLEKSIVLKNIKNRIFPNIRTVNFDEADDILKGREGKEAAFEVLCSFLAEVDCDVDAMPKNRRELYEYFRKDDAYSERLEKIIKALTSPISNKISRNSVEAIYGDIIHLSASRLERYNQCAYSYFLTYGLVAKERDISGVEARGMGNIQHDALRRFFEEIEEKHIDYNEITNEECYKKMGEIVQNAAREANELMYESSSYYRFVTSKIHGIAARTAWEVVKFYRSSKFRPLGFEIKIGTGGFIPILEIERDNKKIAEITGFLDRADIAEINGKKYVSVIDYKSSKKALSEELVNKGVTLQPLLYSDAICRRMNASPAAMYYMQMNNPIIDRSKIKAKEEFEKALEQKKNKELSLQGWLNNDADVVVGHSAGGENGELYELTPKTESEIIEKIESANEKIRQSAYEIFDGNIEVNPVESKEINPCKYCIFNEHCQAQ